MLSAISLHSNNFYILPSEILGLILENISLDIVDTIRTLSAVDVRMGLCVNSAIPYISKLSVSKICMLDLFTGVRHLEISSPIMSNSQTLITDSVRPYNSIWNLGIKQNVWTILESLVIPYEIDVTECFLRRLSTTSILSDQEISSLSSTNYTRLPRRNSCFMPRLRTLDIHSKSYTGNRCLSIDPDIVPSLTRIRLTRCIISNIGKFKNLRSLEISNIKIDVERLNELKIVELFLTGVICSSQTLFNIPTLRKLKVKDGYFELEILNGLKIVELSLVSVWHHGDINLDIPSLRRLNLVSVDNVYMQELSSLECLTLDDSTLNLGIKKMNNLLTLNIHKHRRMNIGITVDKESCPNLRFLNTFGYECRINLEGMLDRPGISNIVHLHKPFSSLNIARMRSTISE